MLLSGQAHVSPRARAASSIGVTRMRARGRWTTVRPSCSPSSPGTRGSWPVPHLHRAMEESFFVLEGGFTFGVGKAEIEAGPGSYVLVPRETRHVLAAHAGGGRCLVLMVPGGQEDMFYELGELGADSLRDPAVRAAIFGRYAPSVR